MSRIEKREKRESLNCQALPFLYVALSFSAISHPLLYYHVYDLTCTQRPG